MELKYKTLEEAQRQYPLGSFIEGETDDFKDCLYICAGYFFDGKHWQIVDIDDQPTVLNVF